MSNLTNSALEIFANIPAHLKQALMGLFSSDSRLFIPYLGVSLILAAIAFMLNNHPKSPEGKAGFWNYTFNPKMYFHPSSVVDLKLILANRIFAPLFTITGFAATVISAQFVATIILGEHSIASNTKTSPQAGLPILSVVTLSALIASDFTTYWVHRIHHESQVLWPFHKLHHSAEVMTPLTFARKHPIYDLIRTLSNAVILGPVQGIIFAIFGMTDILLILGINAAYAIFHWTGSNLRHSHIWLSYGPYLSRILISPAQHQIHHSCALKHYNKNYGEVFALWDWLFGTLYVPIKDESIEFGLADDQGNRIQQPHPSLKDAWLLPLKECALNLYPNQQASVGKNSQRS